MTETAKTITGEIAIRNKRDEQLVAAEAEIEKRLDGARKWFTDVVPAGVDADRFLALALGYCHKNPDLLLAAMNNPESFVLALVHPAQWGLALGTEYHLTHFKDRAHGGADTISGIQDWKGDVQLMLRSGEVRGVHLFVVRGNVPALGIDSAPHPDEWRWQPGMLMPHHVIWDDGLATDEERGVLRAAWGFVTYRDGSTSAPVVMPRSQILQHRGKAKTLKFWGEKDWPAEIPTTVDMWLKTVTHRQYKFVPRSAQWAAREQLAATQWATGARELLQLGQGERVPDLESAGDEYGVDDQAAIEHDEREQHSPAASSSAPQTRKQDFDAIRRVLAAAGLGKTTKAHEHARLVLAMLLGAPGNDKPLQLDSIGALSDEQAARVRHRLQVIVDESNRQGKAISEVLQALVDGYDHATATAGA